MEKKKWISKIKKNCKAVGTYLPAFDPIIETLADILAKRDDAQDLFEKSGGKAIVLHTNKAGAQNLEQNPALRLINDLNRDALQYWKELGLTPSGLRKINDEAMNERSMSPLEAVLNVLEN